MNKLLQTKHNQICPQCGLTFPKDERSNKLVEAATTYLECVNDHNAAELRKALASVKDG